MKKPISLNELQASVGNLDKGKYKPDSRIPCHHESEKHQIMYAGEEDEFFYKSNNTRVPVGDPIGIDVDRGEEVELVLLKGIYWNPQE